MNGGEEIAGGLVVASGDGAELLEFGEEVLDEVARLVDFTIIGARLAPVGFGGDHGGLAGSGERGAHPSVGIESLVGDQRVGLHARQEMVGADEIVCLSAGQEEADRIAERIDQGMDLGAQSAARAPDRLIFVEFFLAPALC